MGRPPGGETESAAPESGDDGPAPQGERAGDQAGEGAEPGSAAPYGPDRGDAAQSLEDEASPPIEDEPTTIASQPVSPQNAGDGRGEDAPAQDGTAPEANADDETRVDVSPSREETSVGPEADEDPAAATRAVSAPRDASKAASSAPVEGSAATANGEETLIARPPTDPGDLAPGAVISSTFEIKRLIGRGGMGQVYLAEHTFQGTQHALKRIAPHMTSDPRIMSLFRREAELLRKISADAIVGYDGVIVHDDGVAKSAFLAMEFAEGPSLKAFVAENGPIGEDEARTLLRRVAAGLAAAHERGVFHRDMSPDNIILVGGSFETAKIIDFGIARDEHSAEMTLLTGAFSGKLSYAAPEQFGLFNGDIDARTDVFSLALTLGYALAGEPVFRDKSISDALESRRAPPGFDRCPERLRPLLAAMTQPDPAARLGSMQAVVEGLDAPVPRGRGRVRAETASRKRGAKKEVAARTRGKPAGGGKRGAAPAVLAGVGALAIAGGGYYLWGENFFSQGREANREQASSTPLERPGRPDEGPLGAAPEPALRAAFDRIDVRNRRAGPAIYLLKAESDFEQRALKLLRLSLSGEAAAADGRDLVDELESLGFTASIEAREAGEVVRQVYDVYAKAWGSTGDASAFSVEIPGEAAPGVAVGEEAAFSARVTYSGRQETVYTDIIRHDGLAYREWNHDCYELGPGREASSVADGVILPDRGPQERKGEICAEAPAEAVHEYVTPSGREYYTGPIETPAADITIGMLVAWAGTASVGERRCRDDGALSGLLVAQPELGARFSGRWADVIAACAQTDPPGSTVDFRIRPLVWAPEARRDEFILSADELPAARLR